MFGDIVGGSEGDPVEFRDDRVSEKASSADD